MLRVHSQWKLNILTVIGTRPQFIKAAALSRAIAQRPYWTETIVDTGQHYDANMSDVFINELFHRPVDIRLDAGGLTELEMLAYIISNLADLASKKEIDVVLVFGDTTSTLGAAIVARKLSLPLVHVEAGVRNCDDYMPEELNRFLVDHMANLNICINEHGAQNLRAEAFGINRSGTVATSICGDLMYDTYRAQEFNDFQYHQLLPSNGLAPGEFVLSTIHRVENVNKTVALRAIIEGINLIHKKIPVVFVEHPRTRNEITNQRIPCDFIRIPPIPYNEIQDLVRRSRLVVTDSGGLKRESYFARKPSVFILAKNIWREIDDQGCSVNSEAKAKSIFDAFVAADKLKPVFNDSLFGDGRAAIKICDEIEKYMTKLNHR